MFASPPTPGRHASQFHVRMVFWSDFGGARSWSSRGRRGASLRGGGVGLLVGEPCSDVGKALVEPGAALVVRSTVYHGRPA